MFENLIFEREVTSLLKNELRQNKESGTYLFYGDKGIELLELVKSFAKGMNCSELEDDYCDTCEVCKKIDSGNYADLEIVGLEEGESKLGIDKIKSTIYKASSSSYEGGKKVFVIKDIESMNKYSANALLKIIEEPPKGTFFMLVSNTLNILPTILSRSIVIKVPKPKAETLGVSSEVYNFFMGNMKEILEFKSEKEQKNLDIDIVKPYFSLGESLKESILNKNIESRISLLRGIDDYIYSINNKRIKKSEKLKLVFDILGVLQDDKVVESKSQERKLMEEIMNLFIIRLKSLEHTEKLLQLKQNLKNNINTQISLTLFFLSF